MAARRRRQEEQPPAGEQGAAPPPAEEPLEDIWGRTPAPAPVAAVRPAPAPVATAEPPAPRRLHPVRALLQRPRDLRRAVVLMMVLGPCRSLEPPERR
ncbi:MAG: hypothetical protein ACT4P3_02590 [Betaproteobacteria bacterium]